MTNDNISFSIFQEHCPFCPCLPLPMIATTFCTRIHCYERHLWSILSELEDVVHFSKMLLVGSHSIVLQIFENKQSLSRHIARI